ncbi:MAG TPA: hypothetical protein VJM77_08490 [Nitrospiria bacterium]|nr:hypothetical protein [Nitrospiria bacterium]
MVWLEFAAWGLLSSAQVVASRGFWIGPYTPVILALYGIALRMVFRYEQKRMAAYIHTESLKYRDVTIGQVYRNVILHAFSLARFSRGESPAHNLCLKQASIL